MHCIGDAKGQTTNYSYFLDNNLQQVSYTNAQIATPTVSYTYDPVYNRVASMTDGTGLTSYGYNPVGVPPALGSARLASIDGPLQNDTITYSYDELGRTTSRSINGAANAASVVYDSLGRMQSATNPLGIFNYSYVNTTGRIDHVDIPGGQKTQYGYFNNIGDQRLKQIKNLNPTGGIISQFDYAYNSVGDITSWTVRQGGAASAAAYTLGYDPADQLRSALLKKVQGGTVLKQYEYDYDPAGNRYTKQEGSTITSSTFNGLNQLMTEADGGKMHFRGTVNEPSGVTVAGNAAVVDAVGNFDGVADVVPGNNTVPVVATDTNNNVKTNNYQVTVSSGSNRTFAYDLDGNLTDDAIKTYEWDAANRLTAINYIGTSNRTEFTYDGLSRRVKIVEKTGNTANSLKRCVWDGLTIAEERNNSNKPTRKHYSQGVQFVSYNPTTTTPYFYMRDHLGSIREMTDSTGGVKARYDYDPWGNRTKVGGSLDADFGFTGHYYHAPSNLHLAPYRAYDAPTGRWVTRDPIGEAGGINLYGYVGNDPLNLTDPLGLWYALIPGTWFDGRGFEGSGGQFFRGPDFDEGAYAGIDGLIPLLDPFADNGYYNKCDDTLAPSHRIGEIAQDIELNLAGGGLLARTQWFYNSAAFGRNSSLFGRSSGALNSNDWLRVGWSWKGSRTAGSEVFRISGGGPLRSGPQWIRTAWDKIRHLDMGGP